MCGSRKIAEQVQAASTQLLVAAQEARKRAYAPYSKFLVGAALLLEDGSIVTGCNVENASYGLSICAERVAMTRAIAQGHRSVIAIAIAGQEGDPCAPCGACRQFLAEFNSEMAVILQENGGFERYRLAELLPLQFKL